MAGSVVLVVGLHLVAAACMGSLQQAQGARPEASPEKTAPRSLTVLNAEGPQGVAPRDTQSDAVPAAAPAREAGVADPSNTGERRYFDIDEVDTPAFPVPDWQVDADRLSALGTRRLSFRILIGDDGIPVQCTVLTIEPPLPSEVSTGLADGLCTTRLNPALLQDRPVPSVRTIELVLES